MARISLAGVGVRNNIRVATLKAKMSGLIYKKSINLGGNTVKDILSSL